MPVPDSDDSRKLAELPHLHDALRLFLARGSNGQGPKVSGSTEPPVPINLAVLDLADELRDAIDRGVVLHRKAANVVGLHPRWEIKPLPCPWCQELKLAREIGTETVLCECGFQISEDKYHGLVRAVVDAEKI